MSLFADVLVVFGKGGFNTHGGNGRCGDNKKARGPLMGPRAEFARITVCLVEFFGVQQFCLGIFGRSDELQRLAGVKVFEEVDERDPVFDHAASNGLNSLRQHRFLGAFFLLDRDHIEWSTVNGDFGTFHRVFQVDAACVQGAFRRIRIVDFDKPVFQDIRQSPRPLR